MLTPFRDRSSWRLAWSPLIVLCHSLVCQAQFYGTQNSTAEFHVNISTLNNLNSNSEYYQNKSSASERTTQPNYEVSYKFPFNIQNPSLHFDDLFLSLQNKTKVRSKRSAGPGLGPSESDFQIHFEQKNRHRRDYYWTPLPSTDFPSSYFPFRRTSPFPAFTTDDRFRTLTALPDDEILDSSEDDQDGETCAAGGRYPPLEDGTKRLLLGVLMTQRGFVTERLGLKIPGAVSYAVHKVNNKRILPENYSLQFEVRTSLFRLIFSSI